ncbi:MAG: serine/threonine protein kinase [Acidobacteria bacterium]|nr:MAG: serine/threonine protein kinase [Acidobacteriota bacterium]
MDRPLQPAPVRRGRGAGAVPGGVLTRRTAIAAALVAAFLGFPPHAAAQTADAWRQFRGSPTLTGVSPTPLPAELKVAWTFEAGESIESSAAIADGAVYVGRMGGELLALDLETGKLRWRYPVEGEGIGESSPSVADGVVYVGDLKGNLHAVGAADGKRVWVFKTGGEVKSSPVVADGKVIVGSYDQHLYALDARTGRLAWKLETEGPVHATAAVAGGLTYVTGCDQRLRAVRIADGKEAFEVSSDAYTGASPAIVGDRAYFGTFENEVLGVDLKAHRIVWRYEHPQRKFPFYSSAAVADGKVVVGGRDKMVHGLDAATGRELWAFATQGRVESSPAITSGRVYVGSSDSRLYVLDLATGKPLWRFDAGAPLSASPALAAGRLVIGSQDGRLYCFR